MTEPINIEFIKGEIEEILKHTSNICSESRKKTPDVEGDVPKIDIGNLQTAFVPKVEDGVGFKGVYTADDGVTYMIQIYKTDP